MSASKRRGKKPSSGENAFPGRSLFGHLAEVGFRFDYHDFSDSKNDVHEIDFETPNILIWVNLEGCGVVRYGKDQLSFAAETVWFAFRAAEKFSVTRSAGDRQRFLTLQYAPSFLRQYLPEESGNLHEVIRPVFDKETDRPRVSDVLPLTTVLRTWVASVRKPPVLTAARPLWYHAKALELACDLFFEVPKGELFCHRQQRLSEARAARVKEILEKRLAEPPSLKELGRLVGCSPYYLSRTFSQESGMTIPQFLRQRRMERAAELLREGRFNVTEVALEVGYNSISHFSQAFCQTMGCCPAMYPMKPSSGKSARSQQ